MPKLTVAVLAVVLAGTASAAGWRSLRVDGSSEDAFAQSLAAFKEKLSPERRHVFGEALKDIWVQGTTAPSNAPRSPWPANQPAPIGPHGERVRGIPDTGPAYQHQLRTMGQ